MKRVYLPLMILSLFALISCESFMEEEEIVCLPTNMTATIVEGSSTKKIIADFHYVPDTDMLDHITWSNHQTHYFEYNGNEQLTVVRQVKVKEKVQKESYYQYDGGLVQRVELINRNLDYIFLEPIDSTYVGYIEFSYEGDRITEEIRYEMPENGATPEMVRRVTYDYDSKGNILSSSISEPGTKSGDLITMTYDSSKHPFSHLNYYFSGESYVNNPLSKQLSEDGLEYNYDFDLNEFGYPEMIYEKLGSANTRFIRYSYLCK